MTKLIYDTESGKWEKYNYLEAKWEPANIGGGGFTGEIETKNKGTLVVENGLIKEYISPKE